MAQYSITPLMEILGHSHVVPYTSQSCCIAIRARLRPRMPLAPVTSSRRMTILRQQSTVSAEVTSRARSRTSIAGLRLVFMPPTYHTCTNPDNHQ